MTSVRVATEPVRQRIPGRTVWATMLLLALVTLVSVGIRVATDWPYLLTDTLPEQEDFEHRYVLHPVLAYAHIGIGAIYLAGAPLQLWRRFREAHLPVHRRLGRVVLTAGLATGVLGVVVGTLFPFGGPAEATAAVVFGHYFVAALVVALLAIRRGEVGLHRRWMIRAFAVGLAVGTIRVWVGFFVATGILSFQDAFGPAFWAAFALHVLAAEAYLRLRSAPEDVTR